MFKKTKVCAGVMLAFGGTLMVGVPSVHAQQTLDAVEVTGSRIKRADAAEALPVTVVSREELEASGQTTVAEVIRNVSAMSQGNFRPQSGSSAQGFSEANLRGLGGRRTLVLVDGRRIAKSPIVGDSVDMNSIPIAAVERIEILTDGASAVYGSEAIGGVINVILRRDFQGVALSYGETKPDVRGGDRQEVSAIMGLTGEKGRMILGASKTSRDIIFVRDYPWGADIGASSYGNNYFTDPGFGSGGSFIAPVPGGCTGPGFYIGGVRCRYDFNRVAADEAASGANSFFARGDVQIAEDWTAVMATSVNRVKSFGRYAPVPGDVRIDPGSPAHPWHPAFPDPALQATVGQNETIYLAHRFAAGGNRDTTTDTQLYDVSVGVEGRIFGADVEAGIRRSTSVFTEIGRGFVIESLARLAISEGTYSVFDPFAASPATLQSFTHTTGRDGRFAQSDYYANATIDLFKMDAGVSRLFVNAEYRKEVYSDIYDSLSESGVVLGSSGNSAAGARKVGSLSSELLVPIIAKQLEATFAARYEKYSDYGSDFSPKVSVRYQPMSNLTMRASAGKGFAAPTLPQLTQKPAFSADSVVDLRTCIADGSFTPAQCAADRPDFQINGLVISNPALTSETSTQFSFGGVWDVTPQISLKADYWNTKIDGVINDVEAQDLVNRDNGDDPRPIPGGLSITRDPVTGRITQLVRGATNEGVLKTSGLDLGVGFGGLKLGGFGELRHELSWSHVFENSTAGFDINGRFGNPKNRGSLANKWSMGPFGATWNINLIGKNGDDEIGFVGSYVTHDIQLAYNTPLKGSRVVVGAVNAGGKLPQLVTDSTKPFNYDLYDGYGAQYYFRLEMKF